NLFRGVFLLGILWLAACGGQPPSSTPADPSGTLVLELTPGHTAVQVSGPLEKSLTGSQSLQLPPGSYRLTLSAEGYDQEQLKLEVGAGESLRLERSLEPTRVSPVVVEPDTSSSISGDNSDLFNLQNTPTYGPEMVINGNFETELAGWTTVRGFPALVSRPPGTAISLWSGRLEQSLNPSGIVSGGQYRLQAMGRFTSGLCQVGVIARVGTAVGLNQTIPFTSSTYTQKSITFTLPSGTTALVVYAEGGICRYDDISVMRNTSFNPAPPATAQTVTYSESDENIINPERGFRSGWQIGHNIGSTALAFVDLPGQRAKGYSMIQAYVSLQNYKNRSIDSTYFDNLRARFIAVRSAGLKVSLRFWYSWSETEADAPLNVVLGHIQQLTPLLREFSDVIAVLQGGFIGAWGEWHASSNGLTSPANQQSIFNALVAALPTDRKIQLRTVAILRQFAPAGITETQAASDPVLSRIGHNNDCLFLNQSDAGTYAWENPQRDLDRAYLGGFTRFIPVGGEMCSDVPTSGYDPYDRRTASGQLAELERFNWSWLADDFGSLAQWQTWGIYNTIRNRLGYRLVLLQSTALGQIRLTDRLQLSFQVANRGFAAPFNPRPVRLVLRNTATQQVFTLSLNTDPRRWYAGTTQTVTLDQPLPAGIPTGTYALFLHLPDAYATLAGRPEYAIRLANLNLWEANTGYNSLGRTLQITN
ncbi:MAG: DUF4832 domain-containing protein, partial [Meiothermus sp.]|nr:DUF4832 domain-containing protein [Meiothermus sp.]